METIIYLVFIPILYSYSFLLSHKPVLYRGARKKGDDWMANRLKFNVDESVWFNQGEEIENILSISLEPDVAVEETGDYVTVKGSLRLGGEYERMQEVQEQEETLERTSEHMAFRIVQEVRSLDDNKAEFQHRFPVEITIPKNRIKNFEEIHVSVESFDYQLPNERHLQLSAQLAIEGIEEDNAESKETQEFEERVKEIYVNDKASFVIDVKREDDAAMDLHEMDEGLQTEEEREEAGPQFELKSRVEEESKEDNPDILASLSKKPEEEPVERREHESVEAVEAEDESEEDAEADEAVVESDEEEPEEKQPVRSENALYLTKMLTREEEQFSRLRMRIIQPGESLDSIAEAYEVQPTQLARLNRLHDEQVEEGQILYIPVNSSENQ